MIGFDEALGEGYSDADLGLAVEPQQLAYIYFTSGSTGEPKGGDVRARRHAQPPLREDR